MNPIAGFKAKIAATGITMHSHNYWSSTENGENAWFVIVDMEGELAKARFYEDSKSDTRYVLGCLAF